MDGLIHPALLYLLLALGGIGVAIALPRPKFSPQILGALIAVGAFGGLFLILGLKASERGELPNFNFYIFAIIALGSALRVITHPRPVYSALYFIMTILSSSALYLIAGAEFMAFALIIIYAGAILITYLFVIMLASQSPSEQEPGTLSAYDAFAREPVWASAAGFALLALLTTMMFRGLPEMGPRNQFDSDALLAQLPGKVDTALSMEGLRGFELTETREGVSAVDPAHQQVLVMVTDVAAFNGSLEHSERVAVLFEPGARAVAVGDVAWAALPEGLGVDNIENVGWELIAGHPMALELAGIILLMAMLGAVVLARKQIELGEDEKAQQVINLGGGS